MTGAVTTLGPPLRIRRNTAWERRYLPRRDENLADLVAFTRLDEATARAGLDARLAAFAATLTRSPFHAERLAAAGLAPSDLRTLADLEHFPSLDRATLGARWREIPALDLDAADAGDSIVVLSSGTTGAPVRVVRDAYDSLYMWTVLGFFVQKLTIELPPRPRVVLLCSLPSGLEYSVRLPLVHDGALHRISIHRPRTLERLRRAAPAVLFTDPAGLHWLAAQPDPPQARLILTSAQRFSPHQRATCARTLAAPIVNYLATTETGPLAWECLARQERFHVLAPDVWLEAPAGELTVTRLRPSVLPLLRYQTGDRAQVTRDDCVCGFHGWTLSDLDGRRACLFITPEGNSIDAWQLAWLFKAYPLAGFRLTQTAPDTFDLELERRPIWQPSQTPRGAATGRRDEGAGWNPRPRSNAPVVARSKSGDRAKLVGALSGGAPSPALLAELGLALGRLGWAAPRITVREVESIDAPGGKPEPFHCAVADHTRARSAGVT